MKHRIVIADDHTLIAQALSGSIQGMDNYEVMYEVENDFELTEKFKKNLMHNILLLTVNIPEMNGY